MRIFRVTVERTTTAEVEVVAADEYDAETKAEAAADRGEFDDVWDNLAADARHVTYGARSVL